MSSTGANVVITCEHGGRQVPARYRPAFEGKDRLLDSHKGWDPGALVIARGFAAALEVPLLALTTTRLLIDANRSESAPDLFSRQSRTLPESERRRLIDRVYTPYRASVADAARRGLASGGSVLHLSCHSFTPVRRGSVRRVDVGLLYDPARPREAAFAHAWGAAIGRAAPALRVRHNEPYKGTDDGLTTTLRACFDAEGTGAGYSGIELEVNQAFPRRAGPRWDRLRAVLTATLELAVSTGGASGR